jgi:hypothetical protein
MAKPASTFTWATDATWASGPRSGNATTATPSSGALSERAQGFVAGTTFPAEWANWALNIAGAWSEWCSTYAAGLELNNTFAGNNTFSGTVDFNGAVTLDSTVSATSGAIDINSRLDIDANGSSTCVTIDNTGDGRCLDITSGTTTGGPGAVARITGTAANADVPMLILQGASTTRAQFRMVEQNAGVLAGANANSGDMTNVAGAVWSYDGVEFLEHVRKDSSNNVDDNLNLLGNGVHTGAQRFTELNISDAGITGGDAFYVQSRVDRIYPDTIVEGVTQNLWTMSVPADQACFFEIAVYVVPTTWGGVDPDPMAGDSTDTVSAKFSGVLYGGGGGDLHVFASPTSNGNSALLDLSMDNSGTTLRVRIGATLFGDGILTFSALVYHKTTLISI